MTLRYLPSLKRIQIQNYSLYPKALDLEYHFIDGVNLIIGGNGVGKTTFLNIIKYALIGLYKKEINVRRREYQGKEKRYDKRSNLPYDFFEARVDPTVDYNEKASVTLEFALGDSLVSVTRDLCTPKVTAAALKSGDEWKPIAGLSLQQSDYDAAFADEKMLAKAEESLQGQYEKTVAQLSGFDYFDSLIFIVNEVLFFNESRKTIMWDKDIQKDLSSKFLIDPEKDHLKGEYERHAKYRNSLGRHKSEEGKAIRRMFSSLQDSEDRNKNYVKLSEDFENKKTEVETLFKQLESLQAERRLLESKVKSAHSTKNSLTANIEDLEKKKNKEERQIFLGVFERLTPKYQEYLEFLKSTDDCPLCNQGITQDFKIKIVSNEHKCMLCENDIRKADKSSMKLDKINKEIDGNLNSLRSQERKIIELEGLLEKIDKRFSTISSKRNKAIVDARALEYEFQRHQTDIVKKTDTEFLVMRKRLDELDKEKEENYQLAKEAQNKANEIAEEIDEQLNDRRAELSRIFDTFSGLFLGQPSTLVYEAPERNGERRYYPQINGVVRYEEEALSESQRFFIDQSFRMSLIRLLNDQASFFMCETPDSSLDISYEQNAAKIFMRYLERPNNLILTSNLNNSEFLDYLISQAANIDCLNLLEIGRQSGVQATSDQLIAASRKVKRKIHERHQ
ncbi:AAA family ATPase [Kordiimonas laminariae]|uniref:AAA family ATPase n=1 Tax=Kordiimonas laminariae TaxID=2917717 RepID=UPI001FF55FC1|nr:AAA family ATPase [Kordiimonas laminariae]